jgi:tRNA-splicing ligase RtcB
MDAIVAVLAKVMADAIGHTGFVHDGDRIQCHHNYASMEIHDGIDLWVTRKGAIDASQGRLGIIPGSMATGSFIVSGTGNPASYRSASHGAGRKMSRNQARKRLTVESLDARMAGIAWNDDADALLDEHPEAYKDLGQVMDNQRDLVTIEHRLETILNYKGT